MAKGLSLYDPSSGKLTKPSGGTYDPGTGKVVTSPSGFTSQSYGAPTVKPQSGGLLHAITHGVTGGLLKVADTAQSIGTGLYALGGAEVNTLKHDVTGGNTALNTAEWSDLLHGHLGRMVQEPAKFKGANSPEAQLAGFEKAQVVSYKDTATNFGAHPLNDALNLLTVASLGAGGIARVANAGRAAGALDQGTMMEKVVAAAKTLTQAPPVIPRYLNLPQVVGEDITSTPVALHASSSPIGRASQVAIDKVLQKGLDSGAASGHYGLVGKMALKRIGGATDEAAGISRNVAGVPVSLAAEAGTQGAPSAVLNWASRGHLQGRSAFGPGVGQQEGQLALLLKSSNVTGGEAATYWRGQAASGVNPELTGPLADIAQSVHEKGLLHIDGGGNVQVSDVAPKLAAAQEAGGTAQGIRENLVRQQVVRLSQTPEQAAARLQGLEQRLNLVGKVMAGGHYEAPTAGKIGVPSQGLLRQRAEVDRLQVLHDRASAAAKQAGEKSLGPQDAMIGNRIVGPGAEHVSGAQGAVTNAHMQLDALLKEHNAALDQIANAKFGAIDRGEVNYRTRQNARAARQSSGVTRSGAPSGASAWKSTTRMTVTDQRRAEAAKLADAATAAHPTDPASVLWNARVAAIERLHKQLNPDIFEGPPKGIVTAPGRVIAPAGAARADRIGGALSVAKDRLAQMEQAAANRVEPTGIVGGEGARPGQGFVSLRTSRKASAQSDVAVSRGKVIPLAQKLALGHEATGAGVAKGLIPASTTQAVAHDLHAALRVASTQDVRARVAALGSDVRRTDNEVLVADPAAEKYAQIPDSINQMLGITHDVTLHPEDEKGVAAAMGALMHDVLPGDKGLPVGSRAPEGYKWIPEEAIPQSLREAVTARGGVEKLADTVNSGVTAATVYLKFSHPAQRALTNATAGVVQGSVNVAEVRKTWETVKALGGLNSQAVRELDAATGAHAYQALPQAGTNLVAKIAGKGAGFYASKIDRPFRVNSILFEFRKIGITDPADITAAMKQVRAGTAPDEVMQAVRESNRAALKYDGLPAAEKRYVARYFWFWPWTRAAVRFTGKTLVEHPYKAAAIGKVGEYGSGQRQNVLGAVPSYEFGLTPFSKGSSPLTGNLSNLMPFGTLGTVAEMAASPLSQANGVFNQLNPVYSGVSALVRGQGLSGALGALTAPTPEAQIYSGARQPTGRGVLPTTGTRMFGRSWESMLARLFVGPPMPRRTNRANLNTAAAHQKEKVRTFKVYSP
jgi:hypothetical protein